MITLEHENLDALLDGAKGCPYLSMGIMGNDDIILVLRDKDGSAIAYTIGALNTVQELLNKCMDAHNANHP